MNKNQKSAKDKAFDKERSRLNKKIRELESQLNTKELETRTLQEQLEKKQNELDEVRDWNERLLGYMDLTEKDMRIIIAKEKAEGEITAMFAGMASILHKYSL